MLRKERKKHKSREKREVQRMPETQTEVILRKTMAEANGNSICFEMLIPIPGKQHHLLK